MNVVVGQRLYRVGHATVYSGVVETVTKKRCEVRSYSIWFVNESSLGKDWFLSPDDARAELLRRLDAEIGKSERVLVRLLATRARAATSEVEHPAPIPKGIAL